MARGVSLQGDGLFYLDISQVTVDKQSQGITRDSGMDSGNSSPTKIRKDVTRNIENKCDNNDGQILGNCNIFMNNWKNFEINNFFIFISKKPPR